MVLLKEIFIIFCVFLIFIRNWKGVVLGKGGESGGRRNNKKKNNKKKDRLYK